jgi:hypothetical protein
MNKLLPFIAFSIIPLAVRADNLGAGSNWGLIESSSGTSTSLAGSAVGTCADGSILFDSNGMLACIETGDQATTRLIAYGEDAYQFSATNTTGGNLELRGGLGTTKTTIATYTNCATDTVTVTVVTATASTANVLTEGTGWTAATSNAATATSLASAIDALAGVGATASSAVVGVTADVGTLEVTIATSDATCDTVANGTDGYVVMRRGLPSLIFGAGDTDTGIGAATDFVYIYGGGLAASFTNGGVTMTGRLAGASGTVALPGYRFSADDNTGIYWIAADNMGLAVNGTKQIDVSTTTVGFTNLVGLGSTTNGSLGTPANGSIIYCSDCTKTTPCAGSGTGALAVYINGAWDCNP